MERALKSVPGVRDAQVNFATEEGRVSTAAGTVEVSSLVHAVERAGYRAAPRADAHRLDRERERILVERSNRRRLAIEAADVTLVRGSLPLIGDALDLSRRTVRTIRQNLFWAFGYNVLAIPMAAGALYPLWGLLLHPTIASAAMALSSVSVVSNSLRLAGWRGAGS